MLFKELYDQLNIIIQASLNDSKIEIKLAITTNPSGESVAKISFNSDVIAKNYAAHLLKIGISSLTNKGQSKTAQADGKCYCIYLSCNEIQKIIGNSDPNFSLDFTVKQIEKLFLLDQLDTSLIDSNTAYDNDIKLENEVWEFIRKGEALVRTCQNRVDADFYVDQIADRTNRPSRATSKLNLKAGSTVYKYSLENPSNTPITHTVGSGRKKKKEANPKHEDTHTLKYSSSLWPSLPHYMTLFYSSGYIGLGWYLHSCDPRKKNYIFSKNVGSNACQWLSQSASPRSTSFEALVASKVTIPQLQDANRIAITKNTMISWNELLAAYPIGRIDFLFCQSKDQRITMLQEMYRYKKKLNIQHNIPLFIIERNINNPSLGSTQQYSYKDRLKDILHILINEKKLKIHEYFWLQENNYEVLRQFAANILQPKRRASLPVEDIQNFLLQCEQRGLYFIKTKTTLEIIVEMMEKSNMSQACAQINNLNEHDFKNIKQPLLNITLFQQWQFFKEALQHPHLDLAKITRLLSLIFPKIPALSLAINEKNGALIKFINHWAEKLSSQELRMADADGNTLLHLATQSQHPLVAVFLSAAGADIYQKNNDNKTPLALAIKMHSSYQDKEQHLALKLIDAYTGQLQKDEFSEHYIDNQVIDNNIVQFYISAIQQNQKKRLEWVSAFKPVKLPTLLNITSEISFSVKEKKECFLLLASQLDFNYFSPELFKNLPLTLQDIFGAIKVENYLAAANLYFNPKRNTSTPVKDILGIIELLTPHQARFLPANYTACLDNAKRSISFLRKANPAILNDQLPSTELAVNTLRLSSIFDRYKWAQDIINYQKSNPDDYLNCYTSLCYIFGEQRNFDQLRAFEKGLSALVLSWINKLQPKERQEVEAKTGNTILLTIMHSEFCAFSPHLAAAGSSIYTTNNLGENAISLALNKIVDYPTLLTDLINAHKGIFYSDYLSKAYIKKFTQEEVIYEVIKAINAGHANLVNWFCLNKAPISFKLLEAISKQMATGQLNLANYAQKHAFAALCSHTKLDKLVDEYEELITLFVSTFQITLNDLSYLRTSPLKGVFLLDYFKGVVERLISADSILKFFEDHKQYFNEDKHFYKLANKFAKNRLLHLKMDDPTLDLSLHLPFLESHTNAVNAFFTDTLKSNLVKAKSAKIYTLFGTTPTDALTAERLLDHEENSADEKLAGFRKSILQSMGNK